MEAALLAIETLDALTTTIAHAAQAQQQISKIYADANANNGGRLTQQQIDQLNTAREHAVASADKALEAASKLQG